ncbi:hypothetical protein BABINDRAFT_160702 [Babjeviella inositovora NRRL Y-12698]|uniref:Amino acid permease/ SLC12A domain-containing protein n=1 Tax=Babjeviella inositovora NRRL Y-12698 TaxID=984486 RepID=A0A1E3QUH9_9ASCO|nr:uncharacterized protein BABINDRAFT_160702 [Babjeviella inositovora NRRL Y-12698]ODQ81343.1 hypothetical protein BABINDRAFT_160702 [Babjeviella inositovora NRRL Y-12698]
MSGFEAEKASLRSREHHNGTSLLSDNNATKEFEMTNQNDLKLQELGYQSELRRSFSIWSILGVGFGLTNSWFGISASLIAGINSGGPLMIVYGIIIIACISSCVGITLSELSSAIPSAGGQYVWTRVLIPKDKNASFWSYLCGSLAWAGAIFTSASTILSISTLAVGFYALCHPDFTPKAWHTFVAFELLNIFIFFFNCYGKILPHIATGALYISLFSFAVITITVLACSKGSYNTPAFVFRDFENATGWESAGLAFIIGLVNPNWSFSCLDCATHMAEEVEEPERIIPISIMGTVAIGFVTSFCYSIAMFFCVKNLGAINASNTGIPILDIYHQALGNKAGAIVLGCLVFLTGLGCNISCHTWQARLCWSFSRDKGLPFSDKLLIIDPRTGVPLYAHFFSCALVALVGCLYLGSSTAFNSMATGCITFLLMSYAIPTFALLFVKGRKNLKHGPFWLGPLGMFANVVTILWTCFAAIVFSFPVTKPITRNNMNYASPVIAGYVLVAVIYWHVKGKKEYRPVDDEAEAYVKAMGGESPDVAF